VISRLKAELGGEISAVHLFEGPTVAALARLLAPAEDAVPTEAYDERRSRGAQRREKLRRLRG
jgi:phthiocerol/phenolphthiocerol synthesis type-I polyketide synthase E